MKLERVVKPLHYRFTVGELEFRASKFEDDHVVFDVLDSGGLKVGEFTATPVGDDADFYDVDYTDKGEYNDTLEMLRKTGDSSVIAKNIKKTLQSIE